MTSSIVRIYVGKLIKWNTPTKKIYWRNCITPIQDPFMEIKSAWKSNKNKATPYTGITLPLLGLRPQLLVFYGMYSLHSCATFDLQFWFLNHIRQNSNWTTSINLISHRENLSCSTAWTYISCKIFYYTNFKLKKNIVIVWRKCSSTWR